MARISKKEQNSKLLLTAKNHFSQSWSSEQDERDLWVEDYQFGQTPGGQSTNGTTGRGESTDRPRFEVNKIASAINEVNGEYRQNDFNVKVRPSTDQSLDLSNTFNGLIRNIQNNNNAKNAHNCAFDQMSNAGMGAWRVASKFQDEETFDQEIIISDIPSAGTTVFPDPLSTDANHRDAKWMHVIQDMSRKEFARRYPNSPISDFDTPLSTLVDICGQHWMKEDSVRISEYWFKKEEKVDLLLLSDGRIVEEEEVRPVLDELEAQGINVVRKRRVKKDRVFRTLLSGAEILEEPKEWAGKFIPIVVVYGYNHWIDSKHYYRGITRLAKDAQRQYNWAISTNIETLAQAPKDPWLVTPKMLQGYKPIWENMNNANTPFLPYNPDPEAPGGKPSREGPPSLSPALVQLQQQAQVDVQSALGNFNPSQQVTRAEQSGNAILANQRQGSLNTHPLLDNMAGAVQYEGEILVDLIPKIYDTRRQLRVMKPDGETELVTVNETVLDEQTGEMVKLNDLSQAKMDVFVDVGPTYQSQRIENINILTRIAESNPEIGAVIPDLIAKNIDFAESEELTKRMRGILLQTGSVEPTEEEIQEAQEKQAQNPPPPPSPMEQAQFESIILDNENKAANVDLINAQAQRELLEAQNFAAAAQQKEVESAETVRKLQLENSKLQEQIKTAQSDRSNKDSDTVRKLNDVIVDKAKEGLPITESDIASKQAAQVVLSESQQDQLETQIIENVDKLRE